MERFLAGTVYLFATLAVAHWAHVNWLLHNPLGCGNVISDPFGILVNTFAPLAAVGLATLCARRIRERRRPIFPFLAFPLFLGTSAALAYEASLFADYGIEIGGIWWLPRFVRRLFW